MNISTREETILKEAINEYGAEMQTLVAIEELSELQKALIKHWRKPSEQTKADIAEEMADVLIMTKQLEMICGNEEAVQKVVTQKINRLEERIYNLHG